MSSDYVSLSKGREMTGLRLLVIRGVPSPWTQAAKGIFKRKGLAHQLVQREPDDPPTLLRDWTGQESFPVAAYDDEPTRSGWAEILLLAERLAPEPALVPADREERVRMFGLCNEIAGEMGFGWCRRLIGVHAGMKTDPPSPTSQFLAPKYGYNEPSIRCAPQRIVDVLTVLRDQLRATPGPYFLGESPTALDIYWATFSLLAAPLPPEDCALPDFVRPLFTATEPEVLGLLEGDLLAHRDRMFAEHLGLPMEL